MTTKSGWDGRRSHRTVTESRVLDTFAVMAYLQEEPGHDRVVELLENALDGRLSLSMCAVNLAEVLYVIERRRGSMAAQLLIDNLPGLPVQFVDAASVKDWLARCFATFSSTWKPAIWMNAGDSAASGARSATPT